MKLKTPVTFSEGVLNDIEFAKDKMILINNNLLRICGVVMETKEEKKTTGFWNRKTEIVKKRYLTEIEVWGWHPTKKFWGTLDEDHAISFLWIKDLEKGRLDFLNLKDSLENVGFEIVKKEKTNDVTN